MKTKELIRLLQEADPSGEEQCCVGNADIYYIDNLPAYYDGTLQILNLNEEGRIVSAQYARGCRKIQIHTCPIDEAIFNDEDLPVTYDCKGTEEHCAGWVDEYRETARRIYTDVARETFVRYVKEKYANFAGDDVLTDLAENYFNAHLSYKDKLPEDLKKSFLSWNERRHIQWDREITWDDIAKGDK